MKVNHLGASLEFKSDLMGTFNIAETSQRAVACQGMNQHHICLASNAPPCSQHQPCWGCQASLLASVGWAGLRIGP